MLSFSLLEGVHAERRGALLGDVVVGVEVAARQAARARRPLDDELARLLIHGVLHLLGHDHAEPAEAARMRAEERRLWRALAPVSPRRRGAWLAAYAVLSFLCFPQPVGDRVLDLGTPLAFLAPAAFWIGLSGLAPRRAAAAGFAAGLAAHALVLHWIYVVTVTYGHAAPPIGVLAVLGLAAWIAAFGGLLGGAGAWLAARGVAGPFVLAALWVATDQLRGFAMTGFPWATLGYALHRDPWLMALAPFAGVYALCFAAALGGASLAALFAGRRRSAAAGLAALAALHGVGAALGAAEGPRGEAVTVALAQGNIDQGAKWSPEWAGRTLSIYEELTRSAAARGAGLVVWPETAVPGSPDADLALRERLEALAREARVTLVVGAVGLEGYDPVRRRPLGPVRYFDSGFVVDPSRGITERYDKAHLVPYGEYVPAPRPARPLRDGRSRRASRTPT